MYSDNETVDVASSDETEEDDDNDANEEPRDEKCELAEKPRSPSLSDILNLGHNNLDFLSEIYNTAFSKVPKVIKIIKIDIKSFETFFSCVINDLQELTMFRCTQVTRTVFTPTPAGPGTTAAWSPARPAHETSTGTRPSVETQTE